AGFECRALNIAPRNAERLTLPCQADVTAQQQLQSRQHQQRRPVLQQVKIFHQQKILEQQHYANPDEQQWDDEWWTTWTHVGLLLVEHKVAQNLVGRRTPQPIERLGLKLPHPLTGHTDLLADLFERVHLAIQQTIPQLQNMRFPF